MSFARFFTMSHIMFFSYPHSDFYNRSRMTGKYLIRFCKKLFYVSTHTCPFRQPVGWHLSQRQSVSLTFTASLRSWKSGSLASRKASRLETCILSFISWQARTAFNWYSFHFYSDLPATMSACRSLIPVFPMDLGHAKRNEPGIRIHSFSFYFLFPCQKFLHLLF